MVIWIFVVLVLTINYTASLTSLYTIQKLEPTITDLNDLLRNGLNVGYTINVDDRINYVRNNLLNVGFDYSKLLALETMEAIDEALSKGSAQGGVAAVVGESPNMMIFLSRYCNKYTMSGPIFKNDGFAFVRSMSFLGLFIVSYMCVFLICCGYFCRYYRKIPRSYLISP